MSNLEKIKQLLADRMHLQAAYKRMFASPDGEVVIRHLMRSCGLLNPKITTNTSLLLIRQGEQRIVLSILRILSMDQHQITKQIQDSMEREEL